VFPPILLLRGRIEMPWGDWWWWRQRRRVFPNSNTQPRRSKHGATGFLPRLK